MSDTYTVNLNYEVTDTSDTTCDMALKFNVVKNDTVKFYDNVSTYYSLPKEKDGDPADVDHPVTATKVLLAKTIEKLLKSHGKKLTDLDPGPGLKLTGLTYKMLVDVEDELKDVFGQLVGFGKSHKKYKG
jgi:hypothetical protein